jgi:hypothetical protein
MTIQYLLRQSGITADQAMFNVKTLLKSVGWTVPRSSDGTTYSATGDILFSAASGTNGFGNSRAWFEIVMPNIAAGPYAGRRSFIVQRHTGSGGFRVRYSKADMFGDGTLQAIAGASLVDTETFTINDGTNPATVFEFDSGGGVTSGNVAVPFTAGDTAATVAAAMVTAINGVGGTLLVTASLSVTGTSTLITLKRDTPGTITLSDTVANAGFTTAVPTATIVSGGSDAVTACGGGTDASPTFTLVWTTAGGFNWGMWADDAAPYGFAAWAFDSSALVTTSNSGQFLFDAMLDGTFTSDVEPYITYVGQGGASWLVTSASTQSMASETNGPNAWFRAGQSNQQYVAAPSVNWYSGSTSGSIMPLQGGTNPWNGKWFGIPVYYIRPAALSTPGGYKGVSNYLLLAGITRTAGSVGTLSTPGDKVVIGEFLHPWDGGPAFQ